MNPHNAPGRCPQSGRRAHTFHCVLEQYAGHKRDGFLLSRKNLKYKDLFFGTPVWTMENDAIMYVAGKNARRFVLTACYYLVSPNG